MSSENYQVGTVKAHGLNFGDTFLFHGMASDPTPTQEGTPVKFAGKIGTKYHLISVTGPEIMTWEFGPSAKIWADTTVKHLITTATRTLDNGDVVHTAECEHGWMTGFHLSTEDAYAVAEGHGEVSRELYVPPTPAVEITGADVEAARVAIRDNGRVFAAEAHNFAPVEAFAILVESGTHTLVNDGDMSRYVRTRRTADRVVITDGLAVWDYNLNPGRVVLSTMDGDGWFNVDTINAGRSLMNGERVTTVLPRTGQSATDALTEDAAPFEVPAPGEIEALRAEHDANMSAWAAPLLKALSAPNPGSVGAIADALVASDRRHAEALAVEVTRPVAEIHTGDGTVVTEADVKTRVREAFGTKIKPGDTVRRRSDGVEGFVRDTVGMGMLDVAFPGGAGYVRTVAELHAMGYDVIPQDAMIELIGAEVTEAEVWAGTGTMIKRPIRALLGRRKRKASKVNARRVRGGF